MTVCLQKRQKSYMVDYIQTLLRYFVQVATRFKCNFCKRHNLRSISIQGEQGSADILSACEFQHDFSEVLSEYSTEQVFNCDDTGLQYRLLPQKTLVSLFEKRAEGRISLFEKRAKGRKKCKDRVTICACANVNGSIKLPLLFIGKAARPLCFTRAEMNNLPVVYKAQKNAWVNCTIFSSWFHEKFVPHVQEELQKMARNQNRY